MKVDLEYSKTELYKKMIDPNGVSMIISEVTFYTEEGMITMKPSNGWSARAIIENDVLRFVGGLTVKKNP